MEFATGQGRSLHSFDSKVGQLAG